MAFGWSADGLTRGKWLDVKRANKQTSSDVFKVDASRKTDSNLGMCWGRKVIMG